MLLLPAQAWVRGFFMALVAKTKICQATSPLIHRQTLVVRLISEVRFYLLTFKEPELMTKAIFPTLGLLLIPCCNANNLI